MSFQSFPPHNRRPRIASTPSISALSAAALVPCSASATRSSLTTQRARRLSSPPREPIESYTLWQPILRASDQIVLYNPASHAINIVPASLNTVSTLSLPFTNRRNANATGVCPYCRRPMDERPHDFATGQGSPHVYDMAQIEMSSDYFQVLQDVNGGVIVEELQDSDQSSVHTQESFARFEDAYVEDSRVPSRRWSRVSIDSDSGSGNSTGGTDPPESMHSFSEPNNTPGSKSGTSLGRSTATTRLAQPSAGFTAERPTVEEPENGTFNTAKSSSGYYSTFFREETRLGMGANGSVYLCQVCYSLLARSPYATHHFIFALTLYRYDRHD
jgi:hypothetical protein